MTSVPWFVVTWRPSSEKVIGFCSAMCPLTSPGDHLGGLVRTLPVQMIFEFVPPLFYDADRRQGRSVSERAERPPEHIFRELVDQANIFGAPTAFVKAVKHFAQPCGAFAARDAPAAGLMRIEMHDPPGQVDHAGIFVENDGAARAQHRADLCDGVIIERDIDFL